MSHLFCAILYERDAFDLVLLDEVLADAEPLDDHEAMVKVALDDRIDAVYYRPPRSKSKSEGYFEGQAWVDEQLIGDLAALIDEEETDQTVYGICYEEISESRYGWRISTDGFERRVVFGGKGERTFLNDHGVYETVGADVAVSAAHFGLDGDDESEFDEAAYHKARAEAESPFCGLELLSDELGVDLDMLLDGLARVWEGEGEQVWPAPVDDEEE
jgi:hypothetical protein